MFLKIDTETKTSSFPKRFSNQIYMSFDPDLKEFSYQSVYSMKYVFTGQENYQINNTEYNINPGSYLLVNNGSQVTTLPSSGLGLSIFLDPCLMRDVFFNSLNADENLLDNPEPEEDLSFLENVYACREKKLQEIIRSIYLTYKELDGREEKRSDIDLFYEFSETLCHSQIKVQKKISTIPAVKKSTREELYRRVLLGKAFIEDHWDAPIFLEDIAREALMSPYHFHRVFSKVFGDSPARYSRKIKMDKASKMLAKGKGAVKDVAFACGFTDQSVFSKAFKREKGISPCQLMR